MASSSCGAGLFILLLHISKINWVKEHHDKYVQSTVLTANVVQNTHWHIKQSESQSQQMSILQKCLEKNN